MFVAPEHTQQDKNKKRERVQSESVWVCVAMWECVSFFSPSAFVTPEVPRGQERILFLSRALFSYTRSPSFFFIHSLLVPSLSFSAALNGPLSLMSD